jgi:hypothetical protein
MVRALEPAAAARVLRAAAIAVSEQFISVPADVVTYHPARGAWCLSEVIGHLIEAERRGFAGRIRGILGTEEPLETWDPTHVSEARRDCERTPEALIQEFLVLREDSASLVAGLSTPVLERAGRHPEVGVLRVADVMHEWIHHDANHQRQVLGNIEAAMWPYMGNARRFTATTPLP